MKALFLLVLLAPLFADADEAPKSEWRKIRPGVWVKHSATVRYTIQKEQGGYRYSIDKPCPEPFERYRVVYTGLARESKWSGSGCNGKIAYTNANAWIPAFYPLPPALHKK